MPGQTIQGGETFVVVARFLCEEARTIEMLGGVRCTVNNRTIHADFDELFEGELAAGETEMELVFTAPHGPVSSSGKHVNVYWEARVDYRGTGLAARKVIELFTLVPGEKLTGDLVLADHSLQPSSSSDRKRESNWKAAMAVTTVAAMVFLISYLTVKSAVALVPAAITGSSIHRPSRH